MSNRFLVRVSFSGFLSSYAIYIETKYNSIQSGNLQNQNHKIVTAVAKFRLYIYNRSSHSSITWLQRIEYNLVAYAHHYLVHRQRCAVPLPHLECLQSVERD